MIKIKGKKFFKEDIKRIERTGDKNIWIYFYRGEPFKVRFESRAQRDATWDRL